MPAGHGGAAGFPLHTTGGGDAMRTSTTPRVRASAPATSDASTGTSASASGTQNYAKHATPDYHKGMAVFTLTKGGLMYEASIGGQRFDYARKGEQLTRSASPEPVEGEVMP